MPNALIYILAGLVALIAGAVNAQAPATCDADVRVVPGSLLSPCITPFKTDVERMEYVFVQELAAPPAPIEKSVCTAYVVLHMGDEWVHPESGELYMSIRARDNDSNWHRVTTLTGRDAIVVDEPAGTVTAKLISKDLDGKFSGTDSHMGSFYYDKEGETVPTITVQTSVTYRWNQGTVPHVGRRGSESTVLADSDGFYDFISNLDKCVGLVYLEYQRLVNEEALRRQKVEAENQAALEEQASLNNIALQKEVLRVEAEIHELRTAVAARINDNVAELALIRERTIQAAIEADRTITALQIEAKRREYESLEKTAQWLAAWAQEKQDEWDEFLATAEDSWKAQIQESRETTAAAIAELEERKTQVEADIAESVRLQSELRAQLTQKDADLDALRTQLDDARAALDAAEARLAEAQAAGDDE